jgi:CheY-like chemotaxis protein
MASAAASPNEEPEGGYGYSRPLRVLVVDDDKDTVVSLLLLLRSEGHDAKGAYDSGAMWEIVDQFRPDAILLDIGLPDRNGYDVARTLRRRFGPQTPMLVAVTAWNKGADKVLAQLAGFDHHVGKPYDPHSLLTLLTPLTLGRRN